MSTSERPPKSPVQQVLGQWPLASVLLGVFAGLVVVAFGHWRTGSTLIGLSIVMGGLFRLLPKRRVGLLAVRNRVLDTLVLLAVGIGITVLAWAVPPMR
ncbi:MAG: DUF3017 domain-containing protein [Micropruina sp.]|uniref:DUF3017 domain-containing protein n=1 Tax=Micropruina sp. TaxID=2737536 RepID=UPI0039E22A29